MFTDERYAYQEVPNSTAILNFGRKPHYEFIVEICAIYLALQLSPKQLVSLKAESKLKLQSNKKSLLSALFRQ